MKKFIFIFLLIIIIEVVFFILLRLGSFTNLFANRQSSTDIVPLKTEVQPTPEISDQDRALKEATIRYEKLKISAEKEGKVVIITNPDGSSALDYMKLNEYEEYMQTEGTSYVNAESIVIWFDNFPSPSLSLEERKKIAFEIISRLRDRVSSGEITMKEAGDIIKQDVSLREVDSAWETNAYREIPFAKKDEKTFFDPEVEKKLWSMKSGELSPVITGKLIVSDENRSDAYYMVLKVNTHEEKEYDSYNDFLNSQ